MMSNNVSIKLRRSPVAMVACALLLTGLLRVWCAAQYDVYSWDSFEGGTVPPNLKINHLKTPGALLPVRFNTGAELLPGIRTPLSLEHCGNVVLKMTTPPMGSDGQSVILSLISDTAMHREKLGDKGKALVQADFYLVKNPANPTMAVLAFAGGVPTQMYRFGVMRGNKAFFSYTASSGKVEIFKMVDLDPKKVEIPGWHRFQIIFEGQNKILCAIDGEPTSFSPITQPTLTSLRPGLMMTSASKQSLVSYADNLSIQWTRDEVPIPRSPWKGDDPTAKASAPGLIWLRSPEQAWMKATTEKRPILVLFFAPTVRSWSKLETLLSTDKATRDVLEKFVLLKMDTNQLLGGSNAQKFNVLRVPCFLIVGPDGKERAKVMFNEKAPWENALKEITAAGGPDGGSTAAADP